MQQKTVWSILSNLSMVLGAHIWRVLLWWCLHTASAHHKAQQVTGCTLYIYKIGLIQNHPISCAVMLPWHFISGKPIEQDWGHLLEIGYHDFVSVYFQSTFLFSVFWKVNWGISRYICSDFWGIAKLGCGGWTFWWRKSHLLIPQTLLKTSESTKCRNKYGCKLWWWQNF